MESFRFLIFIIVLTFTLKIVDSLQCHVCGYLRGFPDGWIKRDDIDESCDNGNIPDDRFVVECDEDFPYASCIKLVTMGKMKGKLGILLNITTRGCHFHDTTIKHGCTEWTKRELNALPNIDIEQKNLLNGYTDDSSIEICTCADNVCTNNENSTAGSRLTKRGPDRNQVLNITTAGDRSTKILFLGIDHSCFYWPTDIVLCGTWTAGELATLSIMPDNCKAMIAQLPKHTPINICPAEGDLEGIPSVVTTVASIILSDNVNTSASSSISYKGKYYHVVLLLMLLNLSTNNLS